MSCEVKRLHEDEDVQKTKGIYEYLLSKELDPFAGRLLNLRTFENFILYLVNGVVTLCTHRTLHRILLRTYKR